MHDGGEHRGDPPLVEGGGDPPRRLLLVPLEQRGNELQQRNRRVGLVRGQPPKGLAHGPDRVARHEPLDARDRERRHPALPPAAALGEEVHQRQQPVPVAPGRLALERLLGEKVVHARPAAAARGVEPLRHGGRRRFLHRRGGLSVPVLAARELFKVGAPEGRLEVEQRRVDPIASFLHGLGERRRARSEHVRLVANVLPVARVQLALEQARVHPDPVARRADLERQLEPLGGPVELAVREVEPADVVRELRVGAVEPDCALEEFERLLGRGGRVDGEPEAGLGQSLEARGRRAGPRLACRPAGRLGCGSFVGSFRSAATLRPLERSTSRTRARPR